MRNQKGLTPIVIVLLVAAVVGVYLVYSGKFILPQGQTDQMTTVSPNKIAYIQADNKVMKTRETGDVWIMDSDGHKKKKITKSPEIVYLIDWSEDNEYLLAVRGQQIGEHDYKNSLVSINIKTGKVTYLADTQVFSFYDKVNVWWLNDREILYINDENLIKIKIDDGTTQLLVDNKKNNFLTKQIEGFEIENINVSSDKSNILVVYVKRYLSAFVAAKLFLYDIKGEFIREISLPKDNSFGTLRDNKIVYFANTSPISVWEMDLNESNKTKLFDYKRSDKLSTDSWAEEDRQNHYFGGMISSVDGKRLLYSVTFLDWSSSNSYLYDTEAKKNYEVYTMNQHIEELKQVNKDAGDLVISRNGKIAVFWVHEAEKYNGMYLRNIEADTMRKICEVDCYSPKISN